MNGMVNWKKRKDVAGETENDRVAGKFLLEDRGRLIRLVCQGYQSSVFYS
jgi:hypothetical protein